MLKEPFSDVTENGQSLSEAEAENVHSEPHSNLDTIRENTLPACSLAPGPLSTFQASDGQLGLLYVPSDADSSLFPFCTLDPVMMQRPWRPFLPK